MKMSTLILLVASAALAQAPAPKPAPQPPSQAKQTAPAAAGPAPVASVLQIMNAMVIPSSEAIFSANDNPTKTDMDWLVLEHNALILAEAGNLLMVPGRAKDRGEWMKHARALVDGGNAAYKAVQARNLKKLGGVGDDLIYPVCEGCHQTYLKR